MRLVGLFWSGKHQRVLRGINLVTLAWTGGDAVYPTDYRLVDPAETPKRTKNDLFRDMPFAAKSRGFAPAFVCFECWYSGKENLKAVRACGWHHLCLVRSNWQVNLHRATAELPIAACGTVDHPEGLG